jgi:hypothetical protein
MRPLPLRERMPLAYLAFTAAMLSIGTLVWRENYSLSMGLRAAAVVALVAAMVMALRTWRSW